MYAQFNSFCFNRQMNMKLQIAFQIQWLKYVKN